MTVSTKHGRLGVPGRDHEGWCTMVRRLVTLEYSAHAARLAVPRNPRSREAVFDWLEAFVVTKRYRDYSINNAHGLIGELPTASAAERRYCAYAALEIVARYAIKEFPVRRHDVGSGVPE